MAGVLEYALSLKTSQFDGPLKQSEGNLGKFDGSASKISSGFGGIAAAAAGAGAVIATFAAGTKAALGVLESYAEFDGLVRGLKTIEGTAADTQARLTTLRDVAKAPGLGFEEAVRGDIRLRAVGLSAKQSEGILRSFGNAIATVGGGAADLDGVILALGQIQSKGKISTEEINQLAERVPQVRAAIKDAFGTADIEALAKSTLTTTEFIDGLTASIGKLPKVTGGAQNTLDNYNDSWKSLKNSASEFAVGISTTWINQVSGAFQQAGRDLQSLKEFFGMATPGLGGEDGAGKDIQAYRKAKADKLKIAEDAAKAERQLEADNAKFWDEKAKERADSERELADDRVKAQKDAVERMKSIQQRSFAATLTEEENLDRQITALRNAGASDRADFAKTKDAEVAEKIFERQVKIAELEKQRKAIEESKADAAEREAEAAERKAEAVAEELAAQNLAVKNFETEGGILEAIAGKHFRLAESLTKQASIEQLKLDLMQQQGLAEDAALLKAQERVALEERAAGIKARGLANEDESQERRKRRQSDEDAGKDLGNTDRLAKADAQRRAERREAEDLRRETARQERRERSRELRPDNAADKLDPQKTNQPKPGDVAQGKAADEKAAREKGKEEDNTLLGEVRQIKTKLASITSS